MQAIRKYLSLAFYDSRSDSAPSTVWKKCRAAVRTEHGKNDGKTGRTAVAKQIFMQVDCRILHLLDNAIIIVDIIVDVHNMIQ